MVPEYPRGLAIVGQYQAQKEVFGFNPAWNITCASTFARRTTCRLASLNYAVVPEADLVGPERNSKAVSGTGN